MLTSAEARRERGPMVPEPFEVISTRQDTADTWTLELEPCSGGSLSFAPGQFTMLSAGGAGEVPISISGDPANPARLVHTVRAVGLATQAISSAQPGQVLGVRGPFGAPWPVQEIEGADVVLAAGGIGLPPLRPAILHLLAAASATAAWCSCTEPARPISSCTRTSSRPGQDAGSRST
jgi:NAD(P)H-flavin reductase